MSDNVNKHSPTHLLPPNKKRSSKRAKSSSVKRKKCQNSFQGGGSLSRRFSSDQNVAIKVQRYDDIDNRTAASRSPLANKEPERRRSVSLCRVAGLSHSLDEPHYFPLKSDFPYFGRRSSCHITYGHVLGDDFHFPVFDPKQRANKDTDPPQPPQQLSNGIGEGKKLKRPLISNDLIENPTKMLKEKFKQKKFPSEDDIERSDYQTNTTPNHSKPVKRKNSMPILNSQKSKDYSLCDESGNNEIDINNNIVINGDLLQSLDSNSDRKVRN